jgi:oligopeptidase B
MQPPHAAKLAHQIEIHGDTIVDDYFWLRDRDNPQVMEYLKAENEYTELVLDIRATRRTAGEFIPRAKSASQGRR